DAIVDRQGGDGNGTAAAAEDEERGGRSRRRRRGGRSRGRDERREATEPKAEAKAEAAPDRRDQEDEGERTVEGVLDLMGNGSGFVRVAPDGEPGDGDVYVSAAQVRRCELVSGDRISGPVRPPRRSERYPS